MPLTPKTAGVHLIAWGRKAGEPVPLCSQVGPVARTDEKLPPSFFQVLFLVVVVLGLYYPALSSGPNSLDDSSMLLQMTLQEDFNFSSLFLPGTSLYYRPLIILSFIVDKYLWDLEPSFMILENIFIHLANTLLVFLFAGKVSRQSGQSRNVLPLLSALLFAIHPLATESINWISGRTDPLATFFLLIASLLIVRSCEKSSYLLLICAALTTICAILSKEMSLFFIPVGSLLILLWPASDGPGDRRRWSNILIFVGPLFLLGVLFLLVRYALHQGNAQDLPYLVGKIQGTSWETTWKALGIFGFYVKKMFVPLPLNFAITTINPIYSWFGGATLIGVYFLFRSGKLALQLLALSFLLTIPAIMLGIIKVAWTPLAERYVYMALPFFCLGVVGTLQTIHLRKTVLVGLAIICLAAGTITFQRNLIWQDKLILYQDTVAKSPDFSLARNELGVALVKKGRIEEAAQQFSRGIELIRKEDEQRPQVLYANLALLTLDKQGPNEALALLTPLLGEKREQASKEVLLTMLQIQQHILDTGSDCQKTLQYREIIGIHHLLYKRTRDPLHLYEAAKYSLKIGDTQRARALSHIAFSLAPAGAHYKAASRIMSQGRE